MLSTVFFPDSSPKNYALPCFLFPVPNRVKTYGYEIKKPHEFSCDLQKSMQFKKLYFLESSYP